MVTPEGIVVGDIEVMPHERRVLVGGTPVDLTSREFDIVLRLAAHPGWVYSAEQLADSDDEESDFSSESVSVHVSHLRRKLADAGASDVVTTVRGIGYRLRAGDEPEESGRSAECEDPAQSASEDGSSDPDRRLKDAFWCLEEAVLRVEHSGSEAQLDAAADVLDDARRAVYGLLAE